MEGNVDDFYDISSNETMLSNYVDRDLYFEIFRESGDESSSILDDVQELISKENKIEVSSPTTSFPNAYLPLMKSGSNPKNKRSLEEKESNELEYVPLNIDVEKNPKKAERQREASKRYRQRKKILTNKLEEKVHALLHEKMTLEQEHKSALRIIEQLHKENEALRSENRDVSEKVEKERSVLMDKLAFLMKNNASDEELVSVLNQLKEICKQINAIGECHFHLALSPSLVTHLVKGGFFQETKGNITPTLEGEGSVASFAHKVIASIDNLMEPQKAAILQALNDCEKKLELLCSERDQLNRDMNSLFHNTNSLPGVFIKREPADVVQMMSSLEYLRTLVGKEIQLSDQFFKQIMMILTPRQQAQLYLQLEYQHSSIIQLKSLWEAFTNSLHN